MMLETAIAYMWSAPVVGMGLGSRVGLKGGSMASLGVGVKLRRSVTSCFKVGDFDLLGHF